MGHRIERRENKIWSCDFCGKDIYISHESNGKFNEISGRHNWCSFCGRHICGKCATLISFPSRIYSNDFIVCPECLPSNTKKVTREIERVREAACDEIEIIAAGWENEARRLAKEYSDGKNIEKEENDEAE